jgi:hypothetical protein
MARADLNHGVLTADGGTPRGAAPLAIGAEAGCPCPAAPRVVRQSRLAQARRHLRRALAGVGLGPVTAPSHLRPEHEDWLGIG